MSQNKLHEDFLKELKELLNKYDSELSTDSRSKGYYVYDQSVIEFNGIYEGDNQRPYSQLDLPSYLD